MKSVLVVGASRGIGRQIAQTLSQNGYKVGVAAKTAEDSPRLPGTIHSVSEEIRNSGGTALPLECNVRNEGHIQAAVQACIKEFGHLDAIVYNAGAITWDKVINTPLKRYDLMMDVNARGAYATVQNVLPHFLKRKTGRILLVAPPIYNRFFKGKTPYSMSKAAKTILVHGLANELVGTGVSITALWPACAIKSHVTEVMGTTDAVLRKPEIFADAVLEILQNKSEEYNGQALIDEDLLRSVGVSDFTKYRCDPEAEPPRMMPKQFPSLLVEDENVTLNYSATKNKI